jgi:hypothetical protein
MKWNAKLPPDLLIAETFAMAVISAISVISWTFYFRTNGTSQAAAVTFPHPDHSLSLFVAVCPPNNYNNNNNNNYYSLRYKIHHV